MKKTRRSILKDLTSVVTQVSDMRRNNKKDKTVVMLTFVAVFFIFFYVFLILTIKNTLLNDLSLIISALAFTILGIYGLIHSRSISPPSVEIDRSKQAIVSNIFYLLIGGLILVSYLLKLLGINK